MKKSRPTGVLRALKFPTRLTTFQKKSSPHTVGIVCPPKEASVRYTMVTFPLWLGFHLESLLNFICMSRPDKKMLLAINRVVNFRYPLIFFHTPIHNIQHHQKTRGAIIGIRFCCGLQLSKLYYQLIKVIN